MKPGWKFYLFTINLLSYTSSAELYLYRRISRLYFLPVENLSGSSAKTRNCFLALKRIRNHNMIAYAWFTLSTLWARGTIINAVYEHSN